MNFDYIIHIQCIINLNDEFDYYLLPTFQVDHKSKKIVHFILFRFASI
jgi:hypothetical protein